MSQQERRGLSPGEHLRAEIERLAFDQIIVADATGVSRQTINNIVNGRQAISRAMAGKLGRLTGRPSDYWLQSRFPDPRDKPERQSSRPLEFSLAQDNIHGFRPCAILVNHQIIRAVQDGIIAVDPFESANVQLASLDLTLDDFIITTQGKEVDISGGLVFPLEAGMTVNVRTLEYIEFPQNYVGRVGPMTRLAKFGIIMSHGFQVDPGFRGNLQFCLFNAGGRSFELKSGAPIISLEFMPLTDTPSIDKSAADQIQAATDRVTVLSHFRSDDCNQMIRDSLRGYVKAEAAHEGFVTTIPELEIELVEASQEAAIASAVSTALNTLAVIRANPSEPTELGDKYEAFFERLAGRLHLTADQYRRALVSFGVKDWDGNSTKVTLRNRSPAILQPPHGSAKITLKHMARQLHEDARDLILALTGARSLPQSEPARAVV